MLAAPLMHAAIYYTVRVYGIHLDNQDPGLNYLTYITI
jgi:hypothetical protein